VQLLRLLKFHSQQFSCLGVLLYHLLDGRLVFSLDLLYLCLMRLFHIRNPLIILNRLLLHRSRMHFLFTNQSLLQLTIRNLAQMHILI
jgi:hypothetical protein